MIAKAIEKIIATAKANIISVESRNYSDKQLNPVYDPTPEVLSIRTLTGIKDYILNKVDSLENDKIIIHVSAFNNVNIYSTLHGSFSQRSKYLQATSDRSTKINFDYYYDVENFIILLQSCFEQTATIKKILQIVGNLKDEAVKTVSDDGFSQQVTAKVGVAQLENVILPNPVSLIPFRTFPEIKQPESKFVFRMQASHRSNSQMPECALFEADGEAWKHDAILKIKTWFEKEIKDITIIA